MPTITTPTPTPTIIDASNADQFRLWFDTRGGVLRWTNLEIASGAAREVFTPALTDEGAPYTAPNWRYGKPEPIDRASVLVNTPETLHTFRGRFKAHYWGPGVATATERKADRLRDAYKSESVYWTWTHADQPGYVDVRIMREQLVPLGQGKG